MSFQHLHKNDSLDCIIQYLMERYEYDREYLAGYPHIVLGNVKRLCRQIFR